MDGWLLRFYVHEGQRVQHQPLWEWLLAQANRMGIPGGSAFRAMAGFGSQHALHEDRFFELAGSQTVEVEFIVGDEEAQRLLELAAQSGHRIVHACVPARFGTVNEDAGGRR